MVECFVVAVVVGILFGDTKLTNVFTGFVLVTVLLNDSCVAMGFMVVDLLLFAKVLVGKTEPLCDSVLVGVKKVSIEVLVKPKKNTKDREWACKNCNPIKKDVGVACPSPAFILFLISHVCMMFIHHVKLTWSRFNSISL